MTVRTASADDAPGIAAIYNQGIAERAATFDTDPVTADDVGAWFGDEGQPLPAAESDGHVVGWARVIRSAEGGYWKLQGGLFTTNEASVALARRCGFREVGVYERHGRLDGEWKSLLIVERLLAVAAEEG
jgi:L-amino acid N-acyltransferase YncA